MADDSPDEEPNHPSLLRQICRLCGERVEAKPKPKCSINYTIEFQALFGINLSADKPSVHPPMICHRCRCMFDRYKSYPKKETFETKKTPYEFTQHSESCKICYGHTTSDHCYHAAKQGGQKRKRTEHAGPGRGGKKAVEQTAVDNIAVDSCGQHCSTQTDKTSQVDTSTQTDASECGYVIDPNEPNVSGLPFPVLCKFVKAAALSQRSSIQKDMSTVKGLHREPQTLTGTDPETYYSNRNGLCTSFVDGLVDEKTTVATKVMTLEQIYHLVSPVFVAPFTFTRNLICYAATNSKLVVNMLGKVSAGGMFETVRSYLDNIASKPLPFPRGDCEVAIDNDQKLKKQWAIRAQGKMTCSIVTSVCQVQHEEEMGVQGREDLSPASWADYMELAKEDERVADTLRLSLKQSKQTEQIHLAEVRKLVHQRLTKVVNQQQPKGNSYTDYIDGCVADMEKKRDVKQCGACGQEVPKNKRVCPNKECLANLKQAEEAAAGKDIFGTMILSPVRKYTYRPKETEVVFSVDRTQATIKKDQIIITPEEHADIPSFHSNTPPPITMSDPVFVNPNSAAAMRRVLRHIGKISNIHRYNNNTPNSRKWLVVAMDGLPMGITRSIIRDTLYCTVCKMSFNAAQDYQTHVAGEHADVPVTGVREFDWVVLRVGKLHLEMNALKSFVDLNFDVWYSALAEEMGFKSEAAQRVARNCADHHKSMQLLEISIKGGTDEMLVAYVREKLERGEQCSISADNFLFQWAPQIRNPNFTFFQQQINLYALAIHNFRIGTRRNNSNYIQAGIEVFSPLFSGRNHPKYQLIDMLDSMDRSMYPADLKTFMEKSESVTSGNKSLGEGMDAKLEEKNKASKAWHKGAPLAADWVRVFRNLDVLEKLRAHFFEVIGVADSTATSSYNRYSLEPEVDVWRARLRSSQYLSEPFNEDAAHTSITERSGKKEDLIDLYYEVSNELLEQDSIRCAVQLDAMANDQKNT
ncbi:hypothetical protein Bbelb_406860 [Branchiostoma belcheri]|nr:hypothetical protein Bbelb_406860 [Branchiostoma belcheri]